MLAGGLAEDVSSLLKGEDADVLEVQKQIKERRKEVARRTIAFQGRIIEQATLTLALTLTLTLTLSR